MHDPAAAIPEPGVGALLASALALLGLRRFQERRFPNRRPTPTRASAILPPTNRTTNCDTFQVLDFDPGQVSGNFDEITIADALPGDLSFDTSALSTTGKISVIPEPGIGALLASASMLFGFRRRNGREARNQSRAGATEAASKPETRS